MKQVMQQKEEQVKILANDLAKAKSVIVFEYLGLNAKDLTALRKNLHKANAKMYVAKNNIFNRAFQIAKIDEKSDLNGPNAILVAAGDEIAPFKELHELMKKHKFIKYKDGILESKHVDAKQLQQIASIPGREGLLSMLLSCLQAPIRNLAYGVKSVGEKKQA